MSSNVVPYRSNRPLRGMGRLGFAIAPNGGANSGESILAAGGITGTGGVSGAAKGAGAGASIGSVAGPFGTAIGAAVGAIIGGLVHFGTGAQRLATANSIIEEIRQVPADFQGRTLTVPVLTELFGALVSTHNFFGYVNPWPGNSPSDIAHEFTGFMDVIAKLIAQTNSTPIGGTVNFSYKGWNGVSFTYSFRNPGSLNSAVYTQQVVIPAVMNWLTHNGAVDVASVSKDLNNPLVQTVFQLMTDYQIGQNPPPMTQGPAPAPTTLLQQQPAAQQPVNAPPAVVNVPMIPPTSAAQIAQTSYLPSAPINVSVAAPAAQQLPTGSGFSLSPTTMLIGAGIIIAVILIAKRK